MPLEGNNYEDAKSSKAPKKRWKKEGGGRGGREAKYQCCTNRVVKLVLPTKGGKKC